MNGAALWHGERLGEAIEAVGRAHGWLPRDGGTAEALPQAGDASRWIAQSAERAGLEAEAVSLRYASIDDELTRLGPSIVLTDVAGERRFLVILRTTRRHARALAPDGSIVDVPLRDLRDALCAAVESRCAADIDRILAATGIGGRRLVRSRRAVLRELVGDANVGELWILRPRLENARAAVREAGVVAPMLGFIGAGFVETLLFVASWWILGIIAFDVRSVDTLLALWILAVLSIVPVRAAATAAARAATARAAALLRRRLLLGALKLQPDEVRGRGAGTHLAHILESAAVEGLASGAAFMAVTAIVSAVTAVLVLARGAGGIAHALVFAAFAMAVVVVTVWYGRARGAWTEARFALTGHVVENMIGHKTRLAQREPDERNSGEDLLLERQLAAEVLINRYAIALDVLRRVWPWAGLLALAPGLIVGDAGAASLAVGAGGVLLGATALSRWVDASAQIAAALVAWRRVAPFWDAAGRPSAPGSLALQPVLDEAPASAMPLLHASSLTYRHAAREVAAVDQAELVVRSGDRVLLCGPSGSGKSTLAAILSGVRPMQGGLLFFRGLDIGSVGLENWRRRVLLAPQFHDNHIFVGTLAYNLLLGRGWPASPADLEEARAVCRGVGLGPLLARMPLGLNQPVGETGWQLSHGERTRVYLARTILQQPAVTILDETFAALDPATLLASIRFVRERADALLVIAHP